jgi:hypothetical protein
VLSTYVVILELPPKSQLVDAEPLAKAVSDPLLLLLCRHVLKLAVEVLLRAVGLDGERLKQLLQGEGEPERKEEKSCYNQEKDDTKVDLPDDALAVVLPVYSAWLRSLTHCKVVVASEKLFKWYPSATVEREVGSISVLCDHTDIPVLWIFKDDDGTGDGKLVESILLFVHSVSHVQKLVVLSFELVEICHL